MTSGQSSKLIIIVTSSENVKVAVHLLASDGVHNVVDLQNGPDRLAREGDGASTDQERLNNILIQNIGNSSIPHINSGSFFTLCVPVSQLCDGSNGVETCILCESIGDNLMSLCKCFETICISTSESIGVQHQFSKIKAIKLCFDMQRNVPRYFRLWSTTTSDEKPFLDETSDYAQGIMQGSVSLPQHQLV